MPWPKRPFRFTIANNASDNKIGIVKRGPKGMA